LFLTVIGLIILAMSWLIWDTAVKAGKMNLVETSTICGYKVDPNRKGPDDLEIIVPGDFGSTVKIEASSKWFNHFKQKYGNSTGCIEIGETLVYEEVFRYLVQVK
jgi:hypothetical protein